MIILRIKKLFWFVFLLPLTLPAQSSDEDLVQFSGVVVTADSLVPIPFANILIQNTNRGTTTDFYGYFSFVAQKGDTIGFSSVGYKPDIFVIPDTITKNRYSLIQQMVRDTIMLPQAVIYPWPTREQFKEAFLTYEPPEDDLERARKNIEKAMEIAYSEEFAMDGSMNYRNYIEGITSRLYYIGQPQPISLLNPVAWAQFIKSWKEGKLKLTNKPYE